MPWLAGGLLLGLGRGHIVEGIACVVAERWGGVLCVVHAWDAMVGSLAWVGWFEVGGQLEV